MCLLVTHKLTCATAGHAVNQCAPGNEMLNRSLWPCESETLLVENYAIVSPTKIALSVVCLARCVL